MSVEILDRMHSNCMERMKSSIQAGDRMKFWSLAQVDIRILMAKLNTINKEANI